MLNQRHVDKLLQDKSNSSKEIEMLKTNTCHLQNKFIVIKKTPMGLRNKSKEMNPISCLEKRENAFRRRVFGLKSILDPRCIDSMDLRKTMLTKSDIRAMLK